MSAPKNIQIDIARGASKAINFTVQDGVDLSSAVVAMTVKKNIGDSDSEILLTKSYDPVYSPNLNTGKFTINLVPADTRDLPARSYAYDLQIQLGDKVYVPIVGSFVVFDTVYRRS